MRRLAPALLVASLLAPLLLAGGCSDPPAEDPIVPQPTLTDIQDKVFTPSCASFGACHDATSPAGQLDLTAGRSHEQLVGVPAVKNPAKLRVVAGDPDASFLIHKMRGELAADEGRSMPLGNPLLHEDTILAIEEWIARGAPND